MCPIPYADVDVVLAGLHLRWNGVWQRPNHVLSRIAADVPVLVVEEPVIDRGADTIDAAGSITVFTPHRSAPVDVLDGPTLAAVRELVGDRRPLIWLYTPMMLALADAFPNAPLVYDKMDELAKFAHADPRIGQRESQVLERARIVFTGGRSLFRTVEHRADNVHCFPSGVDIEHFARAATIAPHPLLAGRGAGPVYGYIGVIDERLDLDLIDALAEANPRATIAMIGPVVKIDPETLPRRANISYLGARAYGELPALLAGIDVALMPFALNEHTENISPTKTLEYLAARRPVVSTAVPDVVADYADVVSIARNRDEFLAAVERSAVRDDARAARAAGRAADASWDAIVGNMRTLLDEAGVRIGGIASGRALAEAPSTR